LKHLRKDFGDHPHKEKLAPIMSIRNITYLRGTIWVSYPDREHQMMRDVLSSETLVNEAYQILLKNSLKIDEKTCS